MSENQLGTDWRELLAMRPERARLLASNYGAVARTYLSARWRECPELHPCIPGVVSEVMHHCVGRLRARADTAPPGPDSFRSFLYESCRDVARTWEERLEVPPPRVSDIPLARAFDQAWARKIVTLAAWLLGDRAKEADSEARLRVELLELCYQDKMTLKEIARLWNYTVSELERQFRRAREEFHEALAELVRYHSPGQEDTVLEECHRLVLLLG